MLVMKNYEAKKPSYFATPSPQLIHALHTALTQILSKPLAEQFQKHIEVSDRVKKAVADLGLKIVATKKEDQAHAMTAIYLPETIQIADVLPKLAAKGVVFAGGIHKAIATRYIRFGHMGVSAVCHFRSSLEKKLLTCVVNSSTPSERILTRLWMLCGIRFLRLDTRYKCRVLGIEEFRSHLEICRIETAGRMENTIQKNWIALVELIRRVCGCMCLCACLMIDDCRATAESRARIRVVGVGGWTLRTNIKALGGAPSSKNLHEYSRKNLLVEGESSHV